jgi:DsbC/DsbD-like thiol-disulfide interchange protein
MRPLLFAFLVSSLQAFAPNLNPVSWKASLAPGATSPGAEIVVKVQASIAEGYHLYSLTAPKGGPIPTKLRFTPESHIATFNVQQDKPELRMDTTFGLPIESFSKETEFRVRAKLDATAPAGPRNLTIVVRYQACSDIICLPPVERMLNVAVNGSTKEPN